MAKYVIKEEYSNKDGVRVWRAYRKILWSADRYITCSFESKEQCEKYLRAVVTAPDPKIVKEIEI